MLGLAKLAFLLLIVSLPFTKHDLVLGGLRANSTDLLFLVASALFTAALCGGSIRLRWNQWFWILPIYFLATTWSAWIGGDPGSQALKIASTFYLAALPFLAFQLIETEADLRRALLSWLAASGVAAGIGLLTVAGFLSGIDRALIGYGLHGFGTLLPGPYPRLEATFSHPAMLCNYLTASLAILMACRHREWLSRPLAVTLLVMILVTAIFTITPGLGGILLLLSLWLWVELRQRRPRLGQLALAAGGTAAIAFVAAAAVTPILHPDAPFLVQVPGTDLVLAGAVRAMTWSAAAAAFVQHPWVGGGIGNRLIEVAYVAPSGTRHLLDDAHNVYLNVAMHSGLLGIGALLLLIATVTKLALGAGGSVACRTSRWLALGWLSAFAYQGLTGSYEDARHLWVLVGLAFAAAKVGRSAASRPTGAAPDPARHP